MFLRTILFFVLLYFLVKVLGRLFLPSGQNRNARRSKSAFEVFYTTLKNSAEQQQRNRQQQQNRSSGGTLKDRLDQIEEAEYEEIDEEEQEPEQKSPKSG